MSAETSAWKSECLLQDQTISFTPPEDFGYTLFKYWTSSLTQSLRIHPKVGLVAYKITQLWLEGTYWIYVNSLGHCEFSEILQSDNSWSALNKFPGIKKIRKDLQNETLTYNFAVHLETLNTYSELVGWLRTRGNEQGINAKEEAFYKINV